MTDESAAPIPEMPFLMNVGLLLTCKCQVTCPHCILEAGPHRTEQMRTDDAVNWIRQIAGYRSGHIRVLALTGGEPFYDLDALQIISNCGREQGLFVSAVTNGFWASTPEKAVETLKRMDAIRLLSISTDVYHQKYIPFERITNAVAAARQCGVACSISVCTDNEQDPAYQRILEQVSELVPKEAIFNAVTFPVGRALARINDLRYDTTPDPPPSACSAGGSPIIFPDGRVIACIGPVIDLKSEHPLLLGNLRTQSLAEILDAAEANPVLHAIRLWGPQKLISMVRDAGLGEFLPRNYIKGSVCNACYCLMKSPQIVAYLDSLAQDEAFAAKVAYGRVYYLSEDFAARQLQGSDRETACQSIPNSES